MNAAPAPRPVRSHAASALAQQTRLREIDLIRIARPLTSEEKAESDRIHDRIYKREWCKTFAATYKKRRTRDA